MNDDIRKLAERLRAFCTETRRIEVGDVHAAADALEVMAREVERLRAENERLTADGIHTCHEQCQRYACVLRRERDTALADVERLRTLGDEAADALETLVAERDRLKAALEAKQTDPASAVCVWTRTPYTAKYSSTCCDENYLHKVTASGMCHRCDKPIKFTEAKE